MSGDNNGLNSSSFIDVLIALITFFEADGDQAIPIKTLKSLLDHYNIY